ncbi:MULTISPECIES: 1,4-dihydroxy-2-naphthoate polyprenyltransferase [Dietzia]|uniref:1,4-dihydroxy-2-naphthoate octaprenyltransferase n=1 Tax=Dietzia maris TaxID=37915 RepID=A0ABT8H1Z0_9ACTN|nr:MULTISPECIES: 1,4-dihydroxy-2-naphthoate polyprenyltransferase [Dietzia]MCZ4539411.1 1,4-dihydroxy-2-naphthoate polyprenyltransferase [Dietzia maris]MCZ4656124.1 1,4-dihydroxy-2-naphthoate polyprenyltransferase [Dietzia kunjamensis]MDJ0422631.1 1,4-dihydroxy-2-naphthoate polyprenyltransferase [Dietzia kunjamensis]MDN4506483.1 1,4-dihydroxy-2-naphthoate polyprenyltransferase [Dietzia maris]
MSRETDPVTHRETTPATDATLTEPGGATLSHWLEGARPRTWPNAFAPVLVGSAAAALAGGFVWWQALLALVVAWSFIVGVNYANDYSDGIRGTDDDRVGPLRLVGSGLARPATVKRAAFGFLGLGGLAGLVLSATSAPWLILVGVACILAAWFYTGGRTPYGYRGFGEVAVFVFFGLVAVIGTQFTQLGSVTWYAVVAAVAVGSFSCAVNLTNNLRDIPSDAESGKITLAVRLGDSRTRGLHAVLELLVPLLATLALIPATPWALLGLLALPVAWKANAPVRARAIGAGLIPALTMAGMAMLAWSVLVSAGFVIASL